MCCMLQDITIKMYYVPLQLCYLNNNQQLAYKDANLYLDNESFLAGHGHSKNCKLLTGNINLFIPEDCTFPVDPWSTTNFYSEQEYSGNAS